MLRVPAGLLAPARLLPVEYVPVGSAREPTPRAMTPHFGLCRNVDLPVHLCAEPRPEDAPPLPSSIAPVPLASGAKPSDVCWHWPAFWFHRWQCFLSESARLWNTAATLAR